MYGFFPGTPGITSLLFLCVYANQRDKQD